MSPSDSSSFPPSSSSAQDALSLWSAAGARRRRRAPRRLWLSVVGLIALVLVMEGIVRHLPPDGVTVTTIEHYAVFTRIPTGERVAYAVRTTSRTTSADSAQTRAEIDHLSNALNTAPFGAPTYLPTTHQCMTVGGWRDYQVKFTWHGLPVQIWTTDNGCPSFAENSGGIPDVLWTRTLSYSDQQILFALR
jgi:hypothetical protein